MHGDYHQSAIRTVIVHELKKTTRLSYSEINLCLIWFFEV